MADKKKKRKTTTTDTPVTTDVTMEVFEEQEAEDIAFLDLDELDFDED